MFRKESLWFMAIVEVRKCIPERRYTVAWYTGWPFRLILTSHWHKNKSSVLVWGPCTKSKLSFGVNGRFEQPKWSPCICSVFELYVWFNIYICNVKIYAWSSMVGGFGLICLNSSMAWFRVCHGPTSEPSTLLSAVPSQESGRQFNEMFDIILSKYCWIISVIDNMELSQTDK